MEITDDLVRALLREQHPDLAGLPVRFAARGWDCQMWRLGDELAVRLPFATPTADDLLRKEHAWLPRLAPHLPLPVPVPQRLGEPSELFPRTWIVTTWVPGEPADHVPAVNAGAGDTLAAFLTALHVPAPKGAPTGGGHRGGPLSEHAGHFPEGLAEAARRGLVAEPDAVRTVWNDAATAPEWDGPPVWLHGDLHPANVLTRDGELHGVIDFGDMAAGDPACDLASAWILLPDDGVERFHKAYGRTLDAATLRRARGWALMRAIGGLLIGDNGDRGLPGGKPTWGPPARESLRRLLAA